MKFITISIIVIGIIVLFNAGGITTPAGGLVKQFLDGGLSTFTDTGFWTTLMTILTVGIGGGVIAGLYGRAPPESYLIAGVVATLGGVVLTDMTTIYLKLWSLSDDWMKWVLSAFFIPFFFAYFVVLISFWRGTDY